MLRRVAQLGEGADRLARAMAVLGGPAPLRHVAVLAGQDLPQAARLADRLRAADVLAPGSTLEFAHPIVRAAIYESMPPGERALAHAEAALLLERDGADPERLALHLLRSEPSGDAHVTDLLRAAAAAASGRGAPGTAAEYLRRALDEPPGPAARPAVLLDLGLALAGERSPDAVAVLQEAVRLSPTPADHATAALLSARVLGLWAHHDAVTAICGEALAGRGDLDPAAVDSLEAELFANSSICGATADEARARAKNRLADPDAPITWRVNDALEATSAAQPADEVLARLAPVLDSGFRGIAPDSLTAVYALLALIWNDELATASQVCDQVLSAARERGSMSMVAHVSCLRSMIMRRFGQLEDAAADGLLALEFKLATSPPLAVAWAAALSIEALTGLGRLDEAQAIAAAASDRDPPAGWIHTLAFRAGARRAPGRAAAPRRGPRRSADRRRRLAGPGRGQPGARVLAHRRGRRAPRARPPEEAAALTGEQLTLARKLGTPINQPWATMALGTARPAARRNAGQYTQWKRTISLPIMCTSAGQYFLNASCAPAWVEP